MADTEVLIPKDDLAPSAPSEDKPAEVLKEEKAETPADDSQPAKQKNSERNGKDGNRPNKNQNQQPKRKDTTIKDLIASIPQFADIGSLEKEVNELGKYANGLPGKLVPANNPQKPVGPVRLNMIRATDIAAGVIQKYNSQSKQLETLKNNESVLQQLANEYTDTFTTYENLIANLETLVSQLTTENTVLKQLLQSNNIPIPAPEEKKKVENKPAPKQNAQKKPTDVPKKTQEQDGKSSPATKKATPPKSAEPAATQPAEAEAVKSEKPKNSPQPGANKQKNSPATKKSNTGKAGASDAAPAAEGEKKSEKPKNSPQPKKNAKNPPANSETNNGASPDAAAPGNKTPNQQKNKKQQNKPTESEPAAS